MCVSVCVCVRERERERDRDRGWWRESEKRSEVVAEIFDQGISKKNPSYFLLFFYFL